MKLSRRAGTKALLLAPLAIAASTTEARASTLRGAIGALYSSSWQMCQELQDPISEEIPLGDGGCYQQFVGGRAYWHPVTGPWWIRYGGLYHYFHHQGGVAVFGYPISAVVPNGRGVNGWSLQTLVPATGARYSLEWENSVGATHVYLSGAIGRRWLGQHDSMGFPLGPEQGLAVSTVYQVFSGGLALWNRASGVSFHPEGSYARTGEGQFLRRTELVLTGEHALVIADSQANYESSVTGTVPSSNTSWISRGLAQVGFSPVHYTYGAIGAVMEKPFSLPIVWGFWRMLLPCRWAPLG